MAELLKSITGLLTPGVIQRAAVLVGESPDDTQRALVARVVPVVLARLATLASSGDGITQVGQLVDGAAVDDLPTDPGRLFGGGRTTQAALRSGRSQVLDLFGGRTDAVARELAASGGVQVSSATMLLELVTPLVLMTLAADMGSGGATVTALGRMLGDERRDVERLLSPGLRNLIRDVGPAWEPPRPRVAASPVRWIEEPGRAWVGRAIAVLLPVLVGVGGLFLWAPWQRETARETAPPRPEPQRLARLALPDGAALDVPEGSFHHELARYLADRSVPAPRTFVFEGLAFESGRSTLKPESRSTVDELAAILKAFPTARIRLEGHTDNVGKPDANQRLSLERAEAVRSALIAGGVEAGRLDAAGFGQERPVSSNATEEGRAKNRRTELAVTQK
jgi:outer membrane protein OmpA-like peptidoglycan-associated protein